MEFLFSFFTFIQKSFLAIGPFFLLLGILIFIHELGHFLVARWCGVKVEIFSLGFGPKILKYRKGDVLYCLSIFPLGGYVKMFGDNPLEELEESEKSKAFLYKSVPQKWLIAFGGPFMNLVFTLLAFFVLALYGLPSLPTKLGDIPPETKAYQTGFRSGDKILSINEKPVSYFSEVAYEIKRNINKKLHFKILSSSGKIKRLEASPELKKNPHPLERKNSIGSIEGLSSFSKGLRIGVIHNSPAYKAGLRTFDTITKINGKDLKYWRQIKILLKQKHQLPLFISVKREKQLKTFQVTSFESNILGIEEAFLYIYRVGANTPAEKAGLKKGDRLISINRKTLKTWKQTLDTISSYSGKAFSIIYKRKGQEQTLNISPESLFIEGNIKKKFLLGIVSGGLEVLPEEILRKRNLGQAFIFSGQETMKWLGFISTGLVRLVQGKISLRTMGGPITIGRIAHSSFQKGLQAFLFMMALISLNLFFLNLLPIPMLDGGHILFFTIEGILGRPLDVKKLLVAQQVGFLILIAFMSFAFFNDIYNWLKAW